MSSAVWRPLVLELVRLRWRHLLVGIILLIVNQALGLVLPASLKFLIDDVLRGSRPELLGPLIIGIILAAALQGATALALTRVVSITAQRLIAELRCRIQAHIGRLPLAYYDFNKTGTLISRIMNDVEGVRNLIGTGLIEFAGGLVSFSIAIYLMVSISVTLTCIVLAVIVTFAAVSSLALSAMRQLYLDRAIVQAEVTGRLSESLGGIRVVKAYRAEDLERKAFSAGIDRLLAIITRTLTNGALLRISAAFLLSSISALVIYSGASQIKAGSLTLGGLISFAALMAFLGAPLFNIVTVGLQVSEGLAGLDRVGEVLREKPEDIDPRRSVMLNKLCGEVEFRNVSFSYQGGRNVLKNVSFRARPGTVTALVGSSGAGKSTIVGLVAAFYTPTSGTVTVDGVDVTTVTLDSYRRQLGMVLQDSFLFDGTIRENVAFSKPDASGEEIMQACQMARVDEFAERFEKKYETVVGERGVRLSGGQKQRISIARAVLANPGILLLDEATSSLDSESEALVQAGLRCLMQNRTTFVIAHRLSTICHADQILVVADGRIIEQGNHDSLYAAGGRYCELYRKQHRTQADLLRFSTEDSECSATQTTRG